MRFRRFLNNIALTSILAFGLSACEHSQKAPVVQKQQPQMQVANMQHTQFSALPTTGMIDIQTIASTDDVQVFPLEGGFADPFAQNRRQRSVFENTTTGGYTVLAPGVQVFPLDGQQASYIPQQMAQPQREVINQATLFEPFGQASPDLPPIIEAPRLTMPVPSAVKPPHQSPFSGSMQSLTGYHDGHTAPTTLSQEQDRAEKAMKFQSLANRSGTSSPNNEIPLAQQEPLALQQRWSSNTATGTLSTTNDLPPEQPRRSSPSSMGMRSDGGFLTGY